MLLLPLYLFPHQVTSLPQHLDGVRLAGAIQLQHALHLPDVGQGTAHSLYGTGLLLLLLLLSTLLLLSALRHVFPFLSTLPGLVGAFTRCITKLD